MLLANFSKLSKKLNLNPESISWILIPGIPIVGTEALKKHCWYSCNGVWCTLQQVAVPFQASLSVLCDGESILSSSIPGLF